MGGTQSRLYEVREKDPREPYRPALRRTQDGDVVCGPAQKTGSRDVRHYVVRTRDGGPPRLKTLDARAGFKKEANRAHHAPANNPIAVHNGRVWGRCVDSPAKSGRGGGDGRGDKPAKPGHGPRKDNHSTKHTSSKTGTSSKTSEANVVKKYPATPQNTPSAKRTSSKTSEASVAKRGFATPQNTPLESSRPSTEPRLTLGQMATYLEAIDHYFTFEELAHLSRMELKYPGGTRAGEKWAWIASQFFDETGRREAPGDIKDAIRRLKSWA